jgi:hypothetical protein
LIAAAAGEHTPRPAAITPIAAIRALLLAAVGRAELAPAADVAARALALIGAAAGEHTPRSAAIAAIRTLLLAAVGRTELASAAAVAARALAHVGARRALLLALIAAGTRTLTALVAAERALAAALISTGTRALALIAAARTLARRIIAVPAAASAPTAAAISAAITSAPASMIPAASAMAGRVGEGDRRQGAGRDDGGGRRSERKAKGSLHVSLRAARQEVFLRAWSPPFRPISAAQPVGWMNRRFRSGLQLRGIDHLSSMLGSAAALLTPRNPTPHNHGSCRPAHAAARRA